MHILNTLAILATLTSASLAGPVTNNKHARFHNKVVRPDTAAGEVFAEALQELSAEASTTSVTPSISSVASAAAATTTSFSRLFTLSGSAPTIAPSNFTIPSNLTTATISAVNSSATLYPNATSTSIYNATSTANISTTAFSSIASSSSSVATTSSSTTTTTSATPSASTTPNATDSSFLRGVNIGNWLVLEKWMDSTDLFSGSFADAVDEWTFDAISGAESALENHWSTWFTESDMEDIAAAGFNAVRIPIGYWAYNNTGTHYISGADDWLEKAVGWARTKGIKVWVDLHGSPGSQNGFDNSGHSGSANWQSDENLQASILVLETMATKYGSSDYADVVVGLELVNEPISWNGQTLAATQQFAEDAYAAVKAAASNSDLVVVTHDGFETPATNWLSVPKELDTMTSRTFGTDSHLYQVFDSEYTSLDGAGHISAACGWSSQLATANAVLPAFVGEWSASMDVCIDTDGTTYAGTGCSTSGCMCTSWTMDSWNDNLKELSGKFIEAQLDTFEQNAAGYFIWAWQGPGAWGVKNLLEYGVMPNPVTSRQYAAQCS